jgi:hypothetical protein
MKGMMALQRNEQSSQPRALSRLPPQTNVSAARDIGLYTQQVVTCEKPKMAWKGPF